MRAGRLRHRVTLESPMAARSDIGEEEIVWTIAATVWAAVEPIRGAERLAANQVQAEMTHRVVIRAYPGLKPSWRIGHDGRSLRILSVADRDERGIEMELICTEAVQP